jgi:hypothetical protein
MQAKVRQMILDEEQNARELEQEITIIQGEGPYNLQCGPLAAPVAFQQNIQGGDPYHPQRGPLVPPTVAFQGINYLDERSSLAPPLQASPWSANFRAGTYPKYNSSTRPGPIHHELPSCRCIIQRGRRHHGQILHHRTRRPSPNLVHQATATFN